MAIKKGNTKKSKPNYKKQIRVASCWPNQRQVMARPERLKYVRKMIRIDGCVFCTAKEQGVLPESLCVYKNEVAMVILNKYPYNSGHVMVLPVRHCADLSDLSEAEHLEVQKLLKRTVEVVKKIYKVEGINIGLNMGAIAGAGLPDHLHWHIVPRWLGDTNFFPLIADTKIVPETLEQTYEKYAAHFR